MHKNRGVITLSLLLFALYFVSLADLDVFGNLLGMSGEREATEQLSLVIVMCTYIFSCISCIYSSNKNEILVYAGYIATTLSIYLSEVGMLTAKVRPIMGVIIMGLLLLGLIKSKSKVPTLLFVMGVIVIGVSTSIDLLLEGVLGYFGEDSELRKIYLERSTLDLEEIIEPIAYLIILTSCIYFEKEKRSIISQIKIKGGLSILFSSAMVGVGHSFLIFSKSRTETLVSIFSIYVGVSLAVYYFANNIHIKEKMARFIDSVVIISVTFIVAISSLGNSSDIVSLLIIAPFIAYCSLHLVYVHPHAAMSRSG